MLRSLADLGPRADPAEVGGKAAGLARLIGAGLPVPPGFVVPTAAYGEALARAGAEALATAPLPGELARSIDRAAADLIGRATADRPGGAAGAGDARLVVRSSATCEDGRPAAAPGIFLSRRDVPPGPALHDAIRAVWSSLHTPVATAYLSAHDSPPVTMAVIVQLQAPGARATIYTRPPGDAAAEHMVIETAEEILLLDRATLTPTPALLAEAARLGLAAEDVLGAPADVEVVLASERVWIVQARPIPAGRPPDGRDAEFAAALDFSAGEPHRLWTWDATHNPDPLSPAQAGLVALVEAAGAAPVHQLVVHGFLYSTPRDITPRKPAPAPRDLARIYASTLRPALERALAPLDSAAPEIEGALAAYVEFYGIYATELAPALAAARGSSPAGRGRSPLARLAPEERARVAAVLSPAWDVVAPTYGETPELLARLLAAAAEPAGATVAGDDDLAAIAEEDDFLFARAQAGVRRALAGVAARWQASLDDVIHLPLELARAPLPPADLAARAAAGRAERLRWTGYTPPLHIVGGRVLRDPREAGDDARVLRGRAASPGRARGRVGETVLVVPTVTPLLAPVIAASHPRALVAEHGGILGHGAALAREMGVPCVVSCLGARRLPHGAEVLVDGDLGLVIRL